MSQLSRQFNSFAKQPWLRRAVVLACVLWIAWSALRIVLSFVGGGDAGRDGPVAAPESETTTAAREIDIERLAGWSLFGTGAQVSDADIPRDEPVLSSDEAAAEQTRLDLQLRGVMAAEDPRGGRAVIAHGNSQDSYGVDDPLPVGNQVFLRRILVDRVLIDNRGRLESLMLYEETAPEDAGAARRRPAAGPTASQPASTPTAALQQLSVLGDSTSEQLSSLKSAVRISPVRDGNEKTLGYRIMPAANRALFDRLGLRQGDILTRLNGVDVGSFDNVLEVYRVLNSADTAEITLLREGREELVRVDLKG